MIGGFLGAGKTTAIAQFGQYLTDKKGLKVGLITNDQANGLVDTTLLRSRGFATEEIAGGCFCCRFSSLTQAAEKLTEKNKPEVFLAEPVGSCTDLVATVTYPLRRLYGDQFELTPFSVLVDPIRASRVLGLIEGKKFSSKVEYIYKKQLLEAHAIVINKSDSVSEELINKLKSSLNQEYPEKKIFVVSALNGNDPLSEWMEWVFNGTIDQTPSMSIDYQIYAEGEALLGWLNATVKIKTKSEFDANKFLKSLCEKIQKSVDEAEGEIAHLKMTLSPHEGLNDVAIINAVRNDIDPNLSQTLEEHVSDAELVINLRAELAPEILDKIVSQTLNNFENENFTLQINHQESFRPGKPVPEHRDE